MKNFLMILIVALVAGSCDSNSDSPTLPQLTLLSHFETPGILTMDVWGYVDPATGREYALIGDFSQLSSQGGPFGNVSIVDVTDPLNPQLTALIPDIIGFDMKIWGTFMYVANSAVTISEDTLSRVVDLTDINNPVIVGSFKATHNIFIDTQGYLYTAGGQGGTQILDLNANPENPTLVWDDPLETGSHDIAIIRNRLYDFHGGSGTLIYDVNDPTNPVLLATVPYAGFNHSGWVTDDDQYLFIMDEGILNTAGSATPEVTIWDISNLSNPTLVGGIANDGVRSHNVYIQGNYALMSYYGGGFRIYDITLPQNPRLLTLFETNLNGGNGIGGEFRGTFGVYPFLPSGNILVSDMNNDLFVFSFE